MHRRDLLRAGVLTGFALITEGALAQSASGKVIPWADQPPAIPPPAQNAIHNLTAWESLDTWITPNDKFFSIAHYNRPTIDAAIWRLNLSGLVKPIGTDPGPIEGSAAPGSHVYSRMLWGQWPPVLPECGWECTMGRNEAG